MISSMVNMQEKNAELRRKDEFWLRVYGLQL